MAAAGGIAAAVRAVRAAAPGLPLEVECDTCDQVAEALAEGVQLILLDNMGLADLRAAVALAAGTTACSWRPAAGCDWKTPARSRRPGWTSSPWARSPTPALPLTLAWTCWPGNQQIQARPGLVWVS